MWPVLGRAQRNYGGEQLPVRTQDEPLVGYRSWLINTGLDGTAVLHSLHINYVWNTLSRADCYLPAHKQGNPIPDPNCLCGLYAQLPEHPLQEWSHMINGRVHASGTVAMSGRVLRCDAGFKAEEAMIQSPVVLAVNCAGHHECDDEVTILEFPDRPSIVYGLCSTHAGAEEPARLGGVQLPATPWMREAIRQLSARYPEIEFLTYHMI